MSSCNIIADPSRSMLMSELIVNGERFKEIFQRLRIVALVEINIAISPVGISHPFFAVQFFSQFHGFAGILFTLIEIYKRKRNSKPAQRKNPFFL